jgi:hypothetical protein
MTQPEREYIYEVGLTNEDRERIYHTLGIHCLSLNDYAEAQRQIESIDFVQDEDIIKELKDGNE